MKRVLICTIGLVSCLSVLQAVQPLSKKEMKLYGSYEDYHDRHGNYIEPYAYDDDDSYDDEYDDYDDYDGDDYDDYEEDEEDDDYYDDDQKEHEGKKQVSYVYNATRAGDQQRKITVGAGLPLNFGTPFSDEAKIKLGGYGTFGYHFFLTDWFAVGADIGFGFNPTIAGHTFNHVPTVAVATLQPSIGNFEFPIAVGVGAAWETYNGETYWPGLVLVGEVGARYKISQSWGVGLDASYKMMPQFARNWNTGEETITGTFLTISACANYYF